MDMYHTPIISEAKRMGVSLLTMDRPMGDKASSPNVWMK